MASCTKYLDFTTEFNQDKVVLVGVIEPDSLLKINLSWLNPPNSTIPPKPILNAKVSFYENGTLLKTISSSTTGNYILKVYPKEKYTYKVKVRVGEQEIEAEDYIPIFPSIEVKNGIFPDNTNPNNNLSIYIKFNNSLDMSDGFWVAPYMTYYENQNLQTVQNYIFCRSEFFDKFNSNFDQRNSGREFDYGYGRLNPQSFLLPNTTMNFTVINQVNIINNKNEEFYFDFIAGSKSFDTYLKSYFLYQKNKLVNTDGTPNNPFAEVSPIYSNIKNGIGLFVGMNKRKVTVLRGEK